MGSKKEGIEYYYEKNRFFELFKKTRKVTDLIWSKEAAISLLMSILFTILVLCMFLKTNHSEFSIEITGYGIGALVELIKGVLPTIIGGLFALLGLTIGGLAIITGTISDKIIDNIKNNNKIDELMSVIYNFYFSGALTGFTILLTIGCIIAIHIPLHFIPELFFLLCFLVNYFVVFSIIYSVMLLGTSIRIFLLKHYYYESNDR